MAVSVADVAEALKHIETAGEVDASRLAGLQNIAQVLGFLYREAKADTDDVEAACDSVELVVRSIPLTPAEVRKAGHTLRKLAFTSLADRLKLIAGRRKHDLRPLA
jgi:hypothetical protein